MPRDVFLPDRIRDRERLTAFLRGYAVGTLAAAFVAAVTVAAIWWAL